MAASKQRLEQALAAYTAWTEVKPTVIAPLHGGLTNENFLLTVDDARYVLRLNSLDDLVWNINRAAEHVIHTQAAAAGMSEAVVHVDDELGYRITQYRPGKTLSQKDFVEMDWLTALGNLLADIHALPGSGEAINYAAHCQHFIDQLKLDSVILEQLQSAIDVVPTICAGLDIQQTVCCHHDLGPYNVLTSEGRLFALDWEYASLGSAVVDLAIVIDEHQLSKQQKKIMLKAYRKSGGQVSKRDLKLVRPVVDLFDLLWNCLYAQQHQKEMDMSLLQKKLKQLKKHVKKSNKLIR